MKQSKLIHYFFGIIAISLAACSKSDSPNNNNGGTAGEGKFVIAALPNSAGDRVADYLFTTDNLESGTLSTTGDGLEQDGSYRYYTTSKNLFFSMLYGQGNPGAVTTYKLNEQGQLTKMDNLPSETVQAFAPVDDDLLMFKISRRATTENSIWYKVNTTSLSFTGEGTVNTKTLSGNGEMAHFSWLKQVGDKVFAPFFSIKGTPSGGWSTDFPDSSWIAVFNYPDMQLEKVIRDNRTSHIGEYFQDGLEVVENGDVYAWTSTGTTNESGEFNSTRPCAIVKINAGTTEYDMSYFFDITKASGGNFITNKLYLGNGNFIFFMDNRDPSKLKNKFAIANVNDQSFKWVTGVPAAETIESVTSNNYSPLDGNTGFAGITTKNGESVVYKFDATNATATPGLTFPGAQINSINWLPAE